MRMRRMIAPWLLVLAALPARAQETRGNINGIVQDKGGVVPGAVVTIPNTDTSQTQPLVTNSSGYFEAVLLNPGTYSVRVELTGYKALHPDRHLAGGRPDGEPDRDAGGRAGHRAGHRRRRGAAARHDHRVVRPELRSAHGRGAADVLEHADHAVALHAVGVAAGRGRGAERLPGLHGRHDERRRRPGRHGERLRQPQHRQQLHDRRRAATTASAAASPARPTPIRSRRCASRRRTSTRRRDTAPG